jgi:hypothetical protein
MRALLAFATVTLIAGTAHAERSIRPALSFDLSLERAWVYGVNVTTVDARFGAGFSTNRKEGTYVDVLGTFAVKRGETQGGSDITGLGVFGPMVIVHTAPLRFGGGFEVGYLSVDRSTASSDQVGITGRLTGLLGVEPFKIGENAAMTIDARAHIGAWGEAAMPGVSLALGVRY